jgi:hypothetical protein
METLDMDHNLFTSNAGDKSLYVQFYMHFNENQTKSQEAGRPVFDDCEFVKIFSPGDRTNIIDRPVRESDKLRFPGQYAAFKANKEQQASGTPLAEWPIVSRSMAEELKYLGFHTVEQIAEANDGAVAKHAGLTNLKVKARAYLELAAGNTKPIEEMTRTVQELQQQLNGRDELIENMKARLDALEKGDKTAKGVTTK